MATTPNQKPVPSEDYANMRFNAGKFDEFMTSTASSYVDRLGITHLTVKGIQASVTGALLPANNLSDVQSAAMSRTNLGATTIGAQVFTATTAANARTAIGVDTYVKSFGLGVGGTSPSSYVYFPITGSNTSPTVFLYADAATSQATSHTPESGVAFAGVHAQASLRPVQFGVSGAGSSAKFYFRGFSTAASVLSDWNLAAKGGANSDITSLTGLTTPLSITQGGTGSTTAAAARTALGAKANAGVTDASNASAGVVGEVLSATTTSTSMSNGVAVNLTSLTLTPGDWDVRGSFRIVGTNLGQILGGITTTSATTPSFPDQYNFNWSSFITATFTNCTPSVRINVNSSTTVYLAMAVGNSSSTATGTGDGYITARRIR